MAFYIAVCGRQQFCNGKFALTRQQSSPSSAISRPRKDHPRTISHGEQ